MDTKELIRRAYELLNAGKLPEAGELFTPDATWSYPGQNALAGEHRGRDAIVNEVFKQLGALSTALQITLLDVLVGDTHNAAIQHTHAEREGQAIDSFTVHVFTMKDGLINAMHSYPYDARAFDAFWAAKAEVAAQ